MIHGIGVDLIEIDRIKVYIVSNQNWLSGF